MNSFHSSKTIDLCNKLITGNQMVQYQTIDKFHSLLEQNATNDAEKLKLINKLVDTLRQIKSKSCCVSLINMLVQSSSPSSLPDKSRLIDFKLLVDTFLRLINTKSENSTYCIHSLTQLLIENKATCIKYYSIRNPSHPFIEILRNATQQNAENLNTILIKQLEYVYESNEDTQDEATLLMKPFFIHVFIETTSSYKHLIAKFLLQRYMDNWSKLNGSLLSLYVTNLRNDEMGSYLFLEFLNEYMKCLILRENNVNCFLEIIDLTKYLIKIDRIFNYNCSNEWKMLTECLHGKTSFEQNQLMEILAENLSLIGNVNLKEYLNLITDCLNNFEKITKLSLAILLPGLFNYIMSFGSINSIYSIPQHKQSIETLIALIEIKIKNKEDLIVDSVDESMFNLADYENVDRLSEKDPNECVNRKKLNHLCTFFLLNETNVDLNKRLCETAKKIVVKWPNQADITLCLNVFNSLIDSARYSDENLCIKLACMKELCKLCTKYNYDHSVYPHLSKEILTVNTKLESLSNVNRLEVLYTKAFCIFEIISHRPDYYAKELLGTIFSLLNGCSSMPNDEGICAILIDALAFLCESEVVDMISTWDAMSSQFSKEKRILALSSYARFLSTASKLEHLNQVDSQNNFYDKALKTLWSMCKLHSTAKADEASIEATNSALKALSKFKKESFKCSHLPLQIQDKLKEKYAKVFKDEMNQMKTIDELFPRIPASCLMDLFFSLNHKHYKGLSEFFQNFLIDEINTMPRRAIYEAREKVLTIDEQQNAQKRFYSLVKICVDDIHGETKKEAGLALTYLLYGYEAPGDRNADGHVLKRHVHSNWQANEETLKNIMCHGHVDINENSLNFFEIGLKRLIENCFNSCLQSLNLEISKELSEYDKLNEKLNLNEKQTRSRIEQALSSTWTSTRTKLMQILVDSYKTNSTQSSLFLIALSSLLDTTSAYVLSLSPTQTPREVHDEPSLTILNQRKWSECLVDFILNIKENKNANENEYISSFNYNQWLSVDELKFLFKLYKTSTDEEILYFLASILHASCINLKISNYLIKYIHNTINLNFKNLTGQNKDFRIKLEALSKYIKMQIKSPNSTIDLDQNTNINENIHFLLNSLDLKKTQTNSNFHLNVLVECLHVLHDEESIYYDEEGFLEKLIEMCFSNIVDSNIETTKNNFDHVKCLVNLVCIGYKANMVNNDKVIRLYEYLNKNSTFTSLIAYFCRFVSTYGFFEAANWIERLYIKWSKYINDFKLKLVDSLEELKLSIQGLLTLTSGISVYGLQFDRLNTLSVDLEKLLKPEQTVKEILKHLKATPSLLEESPILKQLIFILYNFQTLKSYNETYSISNNYDYLDEFSLIKPILNELLILMSKCEFNDSAKFEEDQFKFEFLINLLYNSCKHSKAPRLLPPLNWYFVINTLVKCKLFQEVKFKNSNIETNLIELTLIQMSQNESSKSAYSLVKNYLIDTNYFLSNSCTHKTCVLVLDNFNLICSRLDLKLLRKFLNKLRDYFSSCSENNNINDLEDYFISVLNNLLDYFKKYDNRSDQSDLFNCEMLEFFCFILKEFEFFNFDTNIKERQILDLTSQILVQCNDSYLTSQMLNMNDEEPNEKQEFVYKSIFLEYFYIKCQMVRQNHKVTSLNSLNDFIDKSLKLLKQSDLKFKANFLNIFASAVIDLNRKQQNDTCLKNECLNWFLEFMGMFKSLVVENSENCIEFALEIFFVYIYSLTYFDDDESFQMKIISINLNYIIENLRSYLSKLMRQSHWKQISKIFIDWFMFMLSKLITSDTDDKSVILMRNGLNEMFLIIDDFDISNEIRYKYVNLMCKQLK